LIIYYRKIPSMGMCENRPRRVGANGRHAGGHWWDQGHQMTLYSEWNVFEWGVDGVLEKEWWTNSGHYSRKK
jgi:hypothetical protein